MRQLKVLHLRDTEVLCGPGKTVLETIRLNRDEDIQYEVCAFGDPSANEYLKLVSNEAPVFGLPESKWDLVKAAKQLAERVRASGYDLIHPHEFKTRAVCALAARFTDWPLEVTTIHGFIDVGLKGKLYNRVDLKLIQRSERIFVVSHAMKSRIGEWGLPEDKIDVIRNCIVLENYPFNYQRSTLREELGWSKDRVIFGHIGRLSAEKGQVSLIRAFHHAAQGHDWGLVFAGDGPDRNSLASMIENGASKDQIKLLGHRADIRNIFGGIDVLVLNSLTEGLPNVVLEAMALGVPVIATAVGGTPECIPDDDTGWLIPPADEQALVLAMREAAQSEAERERRRRMARSRVESHFDMHQLIAKTHAIYRQILAKESAP